MYNLKNFNNNFATYDNFSSKGIIKYTMIIKHESDDDEEEKVEILIVSSKKVNILWLVYVYFSKNYKYTKKNVLLFSSPLIL